MPKVSVVIPVFNGERHLRQCLDSVCSQSFSDIEIICVNDGSTDSTLDILNEYGQKDSRVIVITQENRSAGPARNRGMEHASGQYVMFCDSDDYIEKNALEDLYGQADKTDADICVCGMNGYYSRVGKRLPIAGCLIKKWIPDTDTFNRTTNEDYILNFTSVSPCNKLFRRAFLIGNGLKFGTYRNGEDFSFTVIALCMADRITTVSKKLYTYRKEQESSRSVARLSAPADTLYAMVYAAEYLCGHGIMPEKSFCNRAISSIINMLNTLSVRESFHEAVDYLKSEGAEKLLICGRPESDYYIRWHYQFVEHLLHDTADELYSYLFAMNYNLHLEGRSELTDQKEKYRKLSRKAKKTEDEVATLARELADQKKTASRLRKKLKEKEAEAADAADRLEQQKNTVTSLAAALDSQRAQINSLKIELDKHRIKNNALSSELEGQRAKSASLENALEKQQQEYSELEKSLKKQKERTKRLSVGLAESRQMLREIECSHAYRIGKKITWLPGKIKRIIR